MVLIIEPPLNFRPTYKLDIDSNSYDSGVKKRIPAWTDRILYVEKSGLICNAYDSDLSLRSSDHRPVYASFKANIELELNSNQNYYNNNSNNIENSQNNNSNNGNQNASKEGSTKNGFERTLPEYSAESQVCSVM